MAVASLVRNAFLGLLLVIMTLSALGGIAAAVWSAVGAGSGSASTSATVAVTLTPATPTTLVSPGGPAAAVVLAVSNSNAATVRIGTLSLDTARGAGGFAVDALHPNCLLTALTFTSPQTNAGAGWTVPGKTGSVNGTLTVTLASSLSMSVAAANACQGAFFTVYLAAAP